MHFAFCRGSKMKKAVFPERWGNTASSFFRAVKHGLREVFAAAMV